MILHWSKAVSLLLAAALLLTSCMPGVFAGAEGVEQAAQEASKPPLVIAGDTSPLPPLHAEQYEPPRPPLRPFSVSAALFPQVAAAAAGPDALLLALPNAGPAPTPLPVPVGPAFQWSQTDNYLILGTDHRPGWTNWRTDSVIIVGVDRVNNRLGVFSVPRDLYVQIPGYGWGRINQVDYMGEQANPGGGGPKLVSQVLQETLGVSTNHWVRVRMDGFVDVVNAVGGVTVHLDCAFYEPIFNLSTNAWDTFALPAGDVWMDGDTAYWFVRLRLRESDIGRSRRQRQFLWALRDQVSKTNLLARFPDLCGRLSKHLHHGSLCLPDVGPSQLGYDPGCGQCARQRAESVRSAELYDTRRGAGAAHCRSSACAGGGGRRMERPGNGGRQPPGCHSLSCAAARGGFCHGECAESLGNRSGPDWGPAAGSCAASRRAAGSRA